MALAGQHYSFSDRLAFLVNAGWPDVLVTDSDGAQNPLLVIMLAISEKESSGYACAHNGSGNDDSYGLWQINRLAWPQYSPSQLCDPQFNAQVALAIYQKQGLNAWGPWQTGIYAQSMPQAWIAYQQSGGGGSPVDTGYTTTDYIAGDNGGDNPPVDTTGYIATDYGSGSVPFNAGVNSNDQQTSYLPWALAGLAFLILTDSI